MKTALRLGILAFLAAAVLEPAEGEDTIRFQFAEGSDLHQRITPATSKNQMRDVILSVFSQRDTCPDASHWHPPDVSSLSGRAKFEPVSTPLQGGFRFFLHLRPAPPSVCLTVSPA
jgi:hypothetical protein